MNKIWLILLLIACGTTEPQDRRCPRCEQPAPPIPGPGPGPSPIPSTCAQATFEDIKPLLTNKCVSCHPGYDQYPTAVGRIDGFITRIGLDPLRDSRYMPKGGSMTEAEKDLFKRFKSDGLLQQCPQASTPAGSVNYSLPEAETVILKDLNENPITRDNFRYLITQRSLEPSVAKEATDKAINSLSLNSNLVGSLEVANGVFRVNLRDYGLDSDDWKVIEDNDSISFESFTPNGQLIKQITQTRLPWLHVENFAFISQSAGVYYQLLKLPTAEADFLNLNFIGVNFVDQINNLEADYIGFNGSPISINKNRIIQRNVTPVGYLWSTHDVFNVRGDGKNFFQNPVPPEANSQLSFDADASEMIFSLPNGLLGFILFNGIGQRVDFAPTNLVNDNEGIDPQIDAGLDCHRCHYKGLINAEDQIRNAVVGNSSFGLRDQQIVDLLYTQNEQAIINGDNLRLTQVYQELGIFSLKDPLSEATDSLRSDYDLTRLSSFVLLSEQQLTLCIRSSARLQASIGQLLSGGTVTFEQVTVSFGDLKRDCGLGREFL